MSDFDIKITTDPKEIREAQKLRFQVFNLEMKKGLQTSYKSGLDVDDFDPSCDHLIVRDRTSKEVVGTYRLLLGSQASKNLGFYSEREFDLEKIKALDGELLELGRSCARKDFRDRALNALFLKLPSLIKGYLRLGAVVCGPPALDREFGTADFLVLLDMRRLSSEYLRRFGLAGTKVHNAVG